MNLILAVVALIFLAMQLSNIIWNKGTGKVALAGLSIALGVITVVGFIVGSNFGGPVSGADVITIPLVAMVAIEGVAGLLAIKSSKPVNHER